MNIEKNIPMLRPKGKMPGSITTTLRAMEVGDSVVIPTAEAASWRSVARLNGFKIAFRKISDKEGRLWKTA